MAKSGPRGPDWTCGAPVGNMRSMQTDDRYDAVMGRDHIVRALAAGGTVRVVAVVATDLTGEAARRHGARGLVAVALGRAAAAGLLLATLTKDEERLTLQILGTGPIGGVTVDVSSLGTARVFAKRPHAVAGAGAMGALGAKDDGGDGDAVESGRRPSLAGLIGTDGLVSVIRELGLGEPFSGQTPLAGGEIDGDVERYLTDSEQIDSALGCETVAGDGGGVVAAVGVLVQTLPGSEGTAVVAEARQRLRAGALARWLAGATAPAPGQVTANDKALLNGESMMQAVLGEDAAATLEILDRRQVRFFCPCTRERAAATLALLGEAELLDMIRDDGNAHVICEFCRNDYRFTDADLEEIRRSLRPQPAAPS